MILSENAYSFGAVRRRGVNQHMKKIMTVLLLVAVAAPMFADDALILPNRVIRFRTIPAFSFTNQEFDNDGERQDLGQDVDLGALGTQVFPIDSVNVWALNFALEVGVTDQINVAAQWTPGWQFSSNTSASAPSAVEAAAPDTASAVVESIENAQQTGLNDLFLGAKIQILGSSGYIPSETMRLATSVGAKIPLSTYDPDDENENQANGDEYRAGRADRDVWGIGLRVHYDYIFTEEFFLNLYSQTQIFFPRDLDQGGGVDSEFAYGYEQAFEIDPQVAFPISEGLRLGGSLATRFTFTPDIEVEGETVDDSATQLLTVTPQVNAFFTSLPVPIETKLQYSIPVYGVNRNATNTIALQINTYLRF